jgi:hypothetical protein
MKHDNYNPDAELLEIRTDMRNLVDGWYVVYSRTWTGGPSILLLRSGIWENIKGDYIHQEIVEHFNGVIGPIPRWMK